MACDRDPGDPAVARVGDPAVVWVDLPPGGGWTALEERLRSLTGQARVVVIRVPPSGRSGSDDAGPVDVAVRERVMGRLASPDTVFIGVIDGVESPCVGMPLAIALGCDLVLAAERAAFSFSSPELFGMLARVAVTIGRTRALELCLTGRRVPAAEAASLGLVNLVVDRGQVVDAVDDLAAAVLATPRELAIELKRALRATSSDKVSLGEELAAALRLVGDDEMNRER